MPATRKRAREETKGPAPVKIAYWGRFARAAVPLMALTHAGIPCEVESVGGTWEKDQTDRKRFPTGDIPVLYVEGKTICESIAINQYCGLAAGLWPTEPIPSAQVLEVLLTLEEIFTGPWGCNFFKASRFFQKLSDEEFKALRTGPFTDQVKFYMGRVNDIAANNSKKGFTVGTTLTVADFHAWYMYKSIEKGQWDHVPADLLKPFTALTAVVKTVEKVKGSEAWKSLMKELSG